MADDTRLAITIEANTKSMENSLKRLEGVITKSMLSQSRSVKSLDSAFRSMQATATKAAGLFGVVFSARYLVEFVKKNIEAGAAIAELAVKLGISAEATQELSYAAGQAGVQADALVAAFKGMSKVIVDAERGSKAAKDQLAELGLTIADIKGLSPDKAFELISDKISKMQDPLQKTNELVKFFGKTGADLAPLAFKGAAGIDALREKARSLGIILSNETIANAKEAEDTIRDLGAVAQAAGINMAAQFNEPLKALRDLVTSPDFQDGLKKTADHIGEIITWLAKNPEALKVLLGAAAGFAVAGPAGAAVGAGAAYGSNLVDSFQKDQARIAGNQTAFDKEIARYNAARANGGIGAAPTASRFTSSLAGADFKRPAAPGGGADGGVIDTAAADAIKAQEKKYEDLARAIGLETDNLGKSRREQEIANRVASLGVEATQAQKDSITELTGTLFDAKEAQKALNDATDLFAQLGYDAFSGLITGAKSLHDVLGDLVKRLAEAALQAALLGQGPLAGLMGTTPAGNGGVGGAFGAIASAAVHALTGRAGGGPVTAGHPYLVNERTPHSEIFIPNTSGRIAQNNGGMGGGGPIHLFIHNTTTPFLDQHIDVRSAGVSIRVFKEGARQSQRQNELQQ